MQVVRRYAPDLRRAAEAIRRLLLGDGMPGTDAGMVLDAAATPTNGRFAAGAAIWPGESGVRDKAHPGLDSAVTRPVNQETTAA